MTDGSDVAVTLAKHLAGYALRRGLDRPCAAAWVDTVARIAMLIYDVGTDRKHTKGDTQ